MISAQREQLAADRVISTANLMEKEIGYLQTEMAQLGTVASLFAGFIFGFLCFQGSTAGSNPWLLNGGSMYIANPGVSTGFWGTERNMAIPGLGYTPAANDNPTDDDGFTNPGGNSQPAKIPNWARPGFSGRTWFQLEGVFISGYVFAGPRCADDQGPEVRMRNQLLATSVRTTIKKGNRSCAQNNLPLWARFQVPGGPGAGGGGEGSSSSSSSSSWTGTCDGGGEIAFFSTLSSCTNASLLVHPLTNISVAPGTLKKLPSATRYSLKDDTASMGPTGGHCVNITGLLRAEGSGGSAPSPVRSYRLWCKGDPSALPNSTIDAGVIVGILYSLPGCGGSALVGECPKADVPQVQPQPPCVAKCVGANGGDDDGSDDGSPAQCADLNSERCSAEPGCKYQHSVLPRVVAQSYSGKGRAEGACTVVQTPMWASYITATEKDHPAEKDTALAKPLTCGSQGDLSFHTSPNCSSSSRVAAPYKIPGGDGGNIGGYSFQKSHTVRAPGCAAGCLCSSSDSDTTPRLQLLNNSDTQFSVSAMCTEKAGWLFAPLDNDKEPLLSISESVFTLLIGLTLFANVMCVFRSTFLMMWGPRRALMAQTREMERVLIDMRISRRSALQWYMIGNWLFMLSAFVLGICYWQGPALFTITLTIGWGMVKLRRMELEMRKFFQVPPVFTSRFFGTSYDPYSEPLLGDLMNDAHIARDLAQDTREAGGKRYVPPSARS